MNQEEYDYTYDDDNNNYYNFEEDNNNNNEVLNEETHISLTKSKSYSIIKGEECIASLRESLINKAKDFLCRNRDETILILMFCKWNIDKIINNEWFDNLDKNEASAGLKQSKESEEKLKKLGVKQNNTICSICYMPKEQVDEFLSLGCGHYFCDYCWTEYLSAKLSDIVGTPFTHCPQDGCNFIVPESFFFKFIKKTKDKSKLEALTSAYDKSFIEISPDHKWCPFPGCGSFVRFTGRGNKEIECICEYIYCFGCLLEGHRPCPCEMAKAWDRKNNSESENVKWLTVNTKQCPKCKKYIEKNQGCNHMTCRTTAGGCGHEFCWICFADWKGHSTCNKFDVEEAGKKEKNNNSIKLEMEKYVFYFTRYSNHRQAHKKAIVQRNKIEYDIYQFNQLKDLPNDELSFLREGVSSLITSRRLLQNTYIFGFYFLDSSKKEKLEKTKFEYTQGILEKNCDELHGLLEGTTIQTILALESFMEFKDEFHKFKIRVMDLYSVTNEFMKRIIDEIENQMMPFIDYKKVKETLK